MKLNALDHWPINHLRVAQTLPRYAALTAREEMALRLVAKGCTNAQIGACLQSSEETVRNQLTAIYRKLGAGNRAEAVARHLMRYQERSA